MTPEERLLRDITGDQSGAESSSSTIPYESVPQLAASEDFAALMEEARTNKSLLEQLEARQEAIRIEAGAMVAVTGYKSVVFVDLVLTNVDGTTTKGKITGAGLLAQLAEQCGGEDNVPLYMVFAVAQAAKDCDPTVLVKNRFPAALIEPAREPGSPRKGSTQFSWVGAKGGKRGTKKTTATGSGGDVQ